MTSNDRTGLTEDERDRLAEALRHEWGGGRHRYMVWGDLPERDKDRWREEVDILPVDAILTDRLADLEAQLAAARSALAAVREVREANR